MRILHIITGLSLKSGGPTACTYYLLSGLNALGIETDVLTYEARNGDSIISNDRFIHTLPRPVEDRLAYSNEIKKYLSSHNEYQLYHINALWQYPAHATAKYARKHNKPYVLSPHGMLYPSALEYSKIVKKIFWKLWFAKDVINSACLHATSMQEMHYLRQANIKNPVAVISNPVCISSNFDHIVENKFKQGRQKIGFIGRFHPIKNIEALIEAFIKVNSEDYELILIGSGNPEYEQQLIKKTNNSTSIKFTGFLQGEEMTNALRQLSYLILPSHSENFGMVVPEALTMGIPVIASKGTPWEELETHHCGWWVDNDVDTLTSTIETAINTPEETRRQMGENGKRLVKESYSIEVVAGKMKRLYEWILNGGEKPEFVYL